MRSSMGFASIIVALATVAAAPASAQTVAGIVTDTARAGVAGVLIEVVARPDRVIASALSDSAGSFRVPLRRGGTFSLRLSHVSYSPVTARLDEIRSGDIVDVEVLMVPGTIALEPLVVRGRSQNALGGFYERLERARFGHFVTREQIDERPSARASELLRHIPAVVLRPQRVGQNMILLRNGAQTCAPTIYIDGAVIRQDPQSTPDTFLTAEMLEGIEVYRGVYAPPPLHAETQCGVIAFWTRQDTTGAISWRRVATFAGIGAGLLGATLLLLR
jgi:hypothetical protein